MSSPLNVLNPQQKILSIYIEDLKSTIEYLCKIINTIITDDQLQFQSYEKIKQLLGQIKYYQKNFNKEKIISQNILQTIQTISKHTQHKITNQNYTQTYLPPLKTNRNTPFEEHKTLATIIQKQSQQNLIYNYLNKQTNDKKKVSKNSIKNQKTIDNQIPKSLKNSRQFAFIRQETKRSLNNPMISMHDKKPLYKDLQQFKGVQQMMPAVKNYLESHNKRYIKSKNLNYTINKFI